MTVQWLVLKHYFGEVKIHGGQRNLVLVKKPLHRNEESELSCKKFMADLGIHLQKVKTYSTYDSRVAPHHSTR